MELSPSMVVEVASNSSAGFAIRFAARLIDAVFGVLIYYVGGMVGGVTLSILAARGHIPEEWRATLQPLSPLSVVLLVAGGVLYQVLAEAVGGASLGKLLLEGNRRMLPVLKEAGHRVRYREYSGGHNYPAWRDDLWHGLEWLFPPRGSRGKR